MTVHRLALTAAALLLGVTPIAQAGNRHVDISVNLGYNLPVRLGYGYIEPVAPVVVYPAPVIYYRPVYAYPGQYYYRGRDGYEERHERWHHREEHRRYRDRDDD